MSHRILFSFGCVVGMMFCGASAPFAAEAPPDDPSALEFFEKQVRPILAARCYECHSEDQDEPKGGLRVDSRGGLLAGGDTGPAIDLASPEKSLLLDAINYGDVYQMPPKSKMPDEEIAILTQWIKQGAPWPAETAKSRTLAKAEFDLAARKAAHWAWQPVQPTEPPAVNQVAWPLHPVDAFILSGLEAQGLQPAPPADRRTWLRRVYFDLIGLPPTPEEVEAFVQSEDPHAHQTVVERLLDSPHFGERWARHWLDLVRYAETRGHEFDYDIPGAWRYRDYVIRALNADVPYDQLVMEHLAGDLMSPPRLHPTEGFNESILGTGFWFFGEWVHSPVDIRMDETDRVDNMIDVASKTFLGMTVSCARCHDHKFDAISQRDYYALAGFIQSSTYRQVCFESMEQHRALTQEWQALQERTGRDFAQALVESRTDVVGQLAKFLLNSSNAQNDAAAPKGGAWELPTDLAARWRLHLREAKQNPQDPFHLWSQAMDAGAWDATRSRLLAQFDTKGTSATTELIARDSTTILDVRHATPDVWRVDGPTFGPRAVRAGDLLFGDRTDAPLVQFAEYAAARRDSFWNALKLAPDAKAEPGRTGAWSRADRTFRTSTFTLERENLYYLVRGSGHVYAVVDSHRVNNGPLHGSLVHGFENIATPQWVAHPLGRYRGHRAHVEFSARGDAPLEILAVVQADQAPPNPSHNANRLLWDGLAKSESLEALAFHFQHVFQAVLNQVGEGRLAATPDAADRAAIANWLLAHPELTVSDPGALAALQDIRASFHPQRLALMAKIKTPSYTAPAMWEGPRFDEKLLIRGNPKTVGSEVPRRLLEALAGPEPLPGEGSGRLELARQIASPSSPLTARVFVNRVWHHLFGRGIVASVDNFGVLGESPSHPELLDYLATQFVQEGWSVKRLIRDLTLSQTYRMSSQANLAAVEADPNNVLLHHMRIRRLQGEAIRDAMLSVSGQLDPKLYGPSVPVHLTAFMQGRGRPGASGPLNGAGRRSIYGEVRRNFLPPMMMAFDTPAPFSTMGRRNVSNVPAQALILMNDPFVVEQSRHWAERILHEEGLSRHDRVQRLYLAAFSRPADDAELAQAIAFMDQQASDLMLPAQAAEEDVRVWSDLCHVLINVKEFIFLR
jgi:hypothetical protein